MRRILAFILAAALFLLPTGCSKTDIFTGFDEVIDETTVVKDRDMLPGILYAKDGTSFYPVTQHAGRASIPPKASSDFMMTTDEHMRSLPVLYKGETLCIRSGGTAAVNPLQIIRYRRVGPTIGVSGLNYNEALDYCTTYVTSLSDGSSAQSVIAPRIAGKSFGIRDVNGSKPKLSLVGTVLGLEEGQAAALDIFVGTEHAVMTVTADRILYEASEAFSASDYTLSTLGYIAYTLPDTLRDGYYRVGDKGMFRYVAASKSKADKDADINVPNDFTGLAKCEDDVRTHNSVKKTVFLKEDGASLSITIAKDRYAEPSAVTIVHPDGHASHYDPEDIQADGLASGQYTVQLEGINVTPSMVVIKEKYGTGGAKDESREDESAAPEPTETPTETPTPSPAPTETPTPSPAPTETPTPSPTPTETPAPVATSAPTPELTEAPAPQEVTVTEIYEEEEYVDEHGNIQTSRRRVG